MSENKQFKTKSITTLNQPEAMNEVGDMAENWLEWKSAFDFYMTATGKDNAESREKCALFLHIIGKGGRRLLNELDLDDETNSNYEKLVSKFAHHYNPSRNVNHERLEFFNMFQNEECFDKFFDALKFKSRSCEFGPLRSSLILTQIIRGLKDSDMREQLLGNPKLDLEEAVALCRDAENDCLVEVASLQVENAIIQTDNSSVHNPCYEFEECTSLPPSRSFRRASAFSLCDYCGCKHNVGDKCLAWDAICYRCEKLGHFARKCRTR